MKRIEIKPNDVLVIVDIQRDFCSGGPLAVRNAEGIINVINDINPLFTYHIYTRDWHPQNHVSFSSDPDLKGNSWPVHCVQHTSGAEFHPDLIVSVDSSIVNKGTDSEKEEYSGFHAGLGELLKGFAAKRVFITGIATEYCVKNTVLDALSDGFVVYVIVDAIRGVDQPSGSEQKALKEIEDAGAVLCESTQLKLLEEDKNSTKE